MIKIRSSDPLKENRTYKNGQFFSTAFTTLTNTFDLISEVRSLLLALALYFPDNRNLGLLDVWFTGIRVLLPARTTILAGSSTSNYCLQQIWFRKRPPLYANNCWRFALFYSFNAVLRTFLSQDHGRQNGRISKVIEINHRSTSSDKHSINGPNWRPCGTPLVDFLRAFWVLIVWKFKPLS